MIRSVLYVSSAARALDPAELAAIIDLSRRNNARDGITGMLLYHDGNIMQVVEGPRAAIDMLLGRLKRDPRHRRLTVILDGERPDREFGEWTMGCVSSEALPVEDRAALSRFFDEEPAPDAPGVAMRLLRGFKDTMDRF
jgi:Sensors of blue-light using FAD